MYRVPYPFDPPRSTYPFDPLRSNALCDVNETLAQPNNAMRVLIPTAAPFYQKGFSVTDNGRPMVEGVDYYFTHRYVTGTHQTAQRIYGSIWIVNTNCKGPYALKYHTLGGDYTATPAQIAAYMPQMKHPNLDYWEMVIGDKFFPPVDIQFDRDAFIWEPQLIAAIDNVTTAIANKDEHKNALSQLIACIADITDKDMIASVWAAHIASKGPVHGETHYDAEALHKDGIAQNTLSFESMGLDEITEYILGALDFSWITVDKFPLMEQRVLAGEMALVDGLSCLSYRNSAGVLTPVITLHQGAGIIAATNDVLINADIDGNGGPVTITVGGNVLKVNTSGHGRDDKQITLNGVPFVTTQSLFESPAFANRVSAGDVSHVDTNDVKLTGTGKPASPLSATAKFPMASRVTLGLSKLYQTGSNDVNGGISQKAVTDLRDQIANLLPQSRKISGKPLTGDIDFTAAEFGLGLVPNVADLDYPVAPQYIDTLAGVKAPVTHTHNFSNVVLPIADKTKFGITKIGNMETNATLSALDGGAAAAFLDDVNSGVRTVDSFLPNGALEMVRYSPDGYLTAPVNGQYSGGGQNVTYPTFYGEFENDDTFVFLRNGSDIDGNGVFYSYCTFNQDGSIAEYVPTAIEYTPNLNGETVTAVLSGSNGVFLLKTSGGVRLVVTDGTMRVSHHSTCLIANSGLTIPNDAHVTTVGDEVWLIVPTFNATYARFQIYTAKLSDILANNTITLTAKTMTGTDLFGVSQTATTTFRFATTGYVATNTPTANALAYLSDVYATLVINPNGTVIAVEQQGDFVRIAFEFNVYVWTADSATNPSFPMRSATLRVSCTINRLTGATVVKGTGYPVEVARTAIGDGTLPTVSRLAAPSLPLSSSYICRNRDKTMAYSVNQANATIYPVIYNGESTSPDYFDQIDAAAAMFKMLGNGVKSAGIHADVLNGPMYGWGELGANRAFCNISGGKPVLLTYATSSGYAMSGLGSGTRKEITGDLVNQLANMVYVYNGSSEAIAGTVVNSKDGLAYASLSDVTPGTPVSVTAAAFLAANAAVKALNLFDVSLLVTEYGELLVPTDPNLPAVYLYSWIQWDDATKSRREAHNRMFEVTLPNRTGSINQITLGAGYGSQATTNAVVDASFPVSILGNFQIGLLSDGNLAYIMNSRFGINRSKSTQAFSRIAVYDPVNKAWQYTSVVTVTDQTPTGWCYNKTLGTFVLSATANREELYAMVRGNTLATLKSGSTTQKLLQVEKPSTVWNVNFTDKVFGYMNGRGVIYPIKTLDLTAVTPSYKNRTFYLYATSASAGIGDYMASLTLLDDTASRILIGTAVTGNYGIVSLSCNARTRLLSYRELEKHEARRNVHNYDSFTKANAGLAKVANKPAQTALRYPADAATYTNWKRFIHKPTAPIIVLNAVDTNWTVTGGNVRRSATTAEFRGFTSLNEVGDYTFSACFTTLDAVKTETALVLAMWDDGNHQHTLTAVRSNDGLDRGVDDGGTYRRFAVYYDYGLPTCKLVTSVYNDGPIADAANLNWRITATRSNNTFSVSTSPIITGSLPGKGILAASGSFTLDDLPELEIFKDTNTYGYAVRGGRVDITVENDAYEDPLNNYATVEAVYNELYWGTAPLLSGVTTDTGIIPLPAGYAATDVFTILVPFAKQSNYSNVPIKSITVSMNESSRAVTAQYGLIDGSTKPIQVEYYVLVRPKVRPY